MSDSQSLINKAKSTSFKLFLNERTIVIPGEEASISKIVRSYRYWYEIHEGTGSREGYLGRLTRKEIEEQLPYEVLRNPVYPDGYVKDLAVFDSEEEMEQGWLKKAEVLLQKSSAVSHSEASQESAPVAAPSPPPAGKQKSILKLEKEEAKQRAGLEKAKMWVIQVEAHVKALEAKLKSAQERHRYATSRISVLEKASEEVSRQLNQARDYARSL